MSAEGLGAAGLDRGDRTILHWNQRVRCLIHRPKAREDLGQFYLDSCRIRCMRMRAHGALAARWTRRLQEIERCIRAGQVLLRQMEVARRGGQITVSEQALDRVHVGAGFQKMRGEGVTKRMNSAGLGDAGALFGRVEDAMSGVR
jgi:hypothetical protein